MISLHRSVLLAMSISSLLLYCSPRQCGFSVNHLYSRDKFSGSDLYEKSIGICPLLRDTGYDTVQLLNSDTSFEELKKVRTDLHFASVSEMEKHFLKKWDQDSLQLFYNLLFRGEIAVLQTRDSIWNAIKSDYYLVMRMANASTVKTFNNTVSKRLHLEAELWDCRDQEVLWRTRVKGICVNSKTPDRQFLLEAIKSACSQLPATLPSYGNQPW